MLPTTGEPKNPGLNRLPPLDQANQLWFRYQGRSMWPYFLDGDLLVVEPVDFAALRRGDCIVFHAATQDHFVVHRVIGTAPVLQTKGDNRPDIDDEPVTPAMLAGRVITRIRYARTRHVHGALAGRFAAWLHHHLGRLDPSRPTRGGALGRLIAWLLHPLAWLALHRTQLACFQGPDGNTTCYLISYGRPIATRAHPAAPLQFLWPYSLLFGAKPFGAKPWDQGPG